MKVNILKTEFRGIHKLELVQGVQRFPLGYTGNKKEALWYAKQIYKAIASHDAETLKQHGVNELMRSMSEIVKRKGESTNWSGFKQVLHKELKRQYRLMYPESKSIIN